VIEDVVEFPAKREYALLVPQVEIPEHGQMVR
jgi:hypothetical protein